MSKSKKTVAAATAPAGNVAKLRVIKRDGKFRGARQAWYERLCAMDGQPLPEVLAELEAKRPSVYGARSKHAGSPEPVSGWVRFFVRNGYMGTSAE